MNSKPALVLGSGQTALAVLRILGRAAIPSFHLEEEHDFASRSRWSRLLPGRVGSSNPETLTATLESLPLGGAVLLPCTDALSAAVASLPPKTAARFPASTAPPAVVERLLDKGKFAATLEEFGIPHPRTIQIEGDEGWKLLDDLELPRYFLKPRNSQIFERAYHRKAFPLQNHDELIARLRDLRRAGLDVVLQEYISGPPTAHCFIDGFRDRFGRVCARFAYRRLRMFPPGFGDSTLMVSIPLAEVSEAAVSLEQLLESLDYRGIFESEFKYDHRDGVHKLVEVNTRPWTTAEFAALCGVDVCQLAYQDALGLPVEPITEYETGRRFGFLGGDLRAFCALRREDGVSFPSWLRSWRGASEGILRLDDPLPAFPYALGVLRGKAKRLDGSHRYGSQ